jgi:Subtilase family
LLLTVAMLVAGMVTVAADAGATPLVGRVAIHPSSLSLTASQAATHKVIVLLKDQPKIVSTHSSAWKSRRSQILASQAPLARQLKATSKNVRSYQLLNAMAATVSTAEETDLRDNPAVASVIPDEVIKLPASAAKAAAAGTPSRSAPPGTCPSGSTPLLEPQALDVTKTNSDDPTAKTARSLGYTGAGVKVAYMAEGIDINNPDFIRADGSHVFTDYQDFSGDGTTAPTDAAEAFLDASAIASQGRHSYNIQNFTAVPLDKPCTIRIEGMAPGASLVGLKVFAANNATLTSGFVQAIDYAASVDKVDVLNESFGGNPFPDSATADAVRLFNDAAVRAGVTVTASTGDAGPTNTIGSPATDPSVIAVGGSTTYRAYAQTGYGGYYPLSKDGWLDDNISPLSSGGFSQAGRVLDLIAPGDIDFAICTPDPDLYQGCLNFAGQPSPVEESGGTSESAPLTAGAAALVIQAYRHAHGGSSPTPELVKQLLTSTSDDLGHPAQEQGAGRLNSYQAVLAALSVHDKNGKPARTGSTVLTDKTQLDAVALPGTGVNSTLRLTNNGATSQTLALSQRTLGPVIDSRTGSVTLSDAASQHFTDYAGQQTNFEVRHFSIPSGRARLDVDYVYPGDPNGTLNARVRLALIDPRGRFAAHSLPQGVGNAGHVDVRSPAAGSWTVMIWSRTSAVGGTTGKVTYKAATHNFRRVGSVVPSSVTLAAGASRTVTVHASIPTQPGDQANSVVITSKRHQTSVPVALRALVNLKNGGKYSGVLTGGNGRESNTGQTGYYQFTVPKGQRDLTANFTLSGGATDPVFGYLIDPAGNAQAYAANAELTDFDSHGNPVTTPLSSLSMFARAPAAGRWTLILDFAPVVTGTTLARPYSGTVVLNKVQASASGLPNSSKVTLKAGRPVTVPVTVRNTGVAPQSFFIDPRTNSLSRLTLAQLSQGPFDLPLKPTSSLPYWNVPTETTKVTIDVTATLPVNFDYGWLFGFGDPDIEATSHGNSATGTYSGHPVPSGAWFASPAEIGPFGPAGAPSGTADLTLTATTLGFDPAVTTPIGDFEAGSVDPSTPFGIVTVQPGHSLTIPVTITPSGKKGTVVSGRLFVDDLAFLTFLGAVPSGQELSALPYKYTIG